MNKKLLSLLVSGSLIAVVSTSVFATDTGVVNFNGKIVADTCEINVNESASTTGTVTFADTYPADYSGDGSIGTSKDFKIELIKCDPLVDKLNLTFSERQRMQVSCVWKIAKLGLAVQQMWVLR